MDFVIMNPNETYSIWKAIKCKTHDRTPVSLAIFISNTPMEFITKLVT